MPIKWVKHHTPQNTYARKVLALLSIYDLTGDWLSGPPTIDGVYNYCCATIEEAKGKNRKYAYANDIVAIREDNAVNVYIKGAMTGNDTLLCSYVFEDSKVIIEVAPKGIRSNCWACIAKKNGVKSRVALIHTCGK